MAPMPFMTLSAGALDVMLMAKSKLETGLERLFKSTGINRWIECMGGKFWLVTFSPGFDLMW